MQPTARTKLCRHPALRLEEGVRELPLLTVQSTVIALAFWNIFVRALRLTRLQERNIGIVCKQDYNGKGVACAGSVVRLCTMRMLLSVPNT